MFFIICKGFIQYGSTFIILPYSTVIHIFMQLIIYIYTTFYIAICNSCGTIVYNMYLCPNPSPLCTMKIDYGLNEMSSINETRRLRGFPREELPSTMKEKKHLRINYHIIKHSRFVLYKKSLSNFLFSLRIMKAENSYCHASLLILYTVGL